VSIHLPTRPSQHRRTIVSKAYSDSYCRTSLKPTQSQSTRQGSTASLLPRRQPSVSPARGADDSLVPDVKEFCHIGLPTSKDTDISWWRYYGKSAVVSLSSVRCDTPQQRTADMARPVSMSDAHVYRGAVYWRRLVSMLPLHATRPESLNDHSLHVDNSYDKTFHDTRRGLRDTRTVLLATTIILLPPYYNTITILPHFHTTTPSNYQTTRPPDHHTTTSHTTPHTHTSYDKTTHRGIEKAIRREHCSRRSSLYTYL
jgi:hypothetical protein